MTLAVRFHRSGGPEVLELETVKLPEPGPGEVLVQHGAIGINFIDTYQRSGLYPLPLPSGLGQEAAGVVQAIGDDVKGFAVGDRVVCGWGPPGAYAEARVVRADRLLALPPEIGFETAAAMMLKGMTVEYLIRRTYPAQKGQTVLLHAAAGGVGLIACQWLNHLGVKVIGTVGSKEKAELAAAHGCDYPVIYTRENFVERVREITGGKGVPVVFDSVGKDTFTGSLDCLAPRGTLVCFGSASGKPEPFDVAVLAQKGSLFLTRTTLATYIATRSELEESARALFDVVLRGKVKILIGQRWPLRDVQAAHRALEARNTVGSSLLIP
jgi:NADPH2:quinone reductase